MKSFKQYILVEKEKKPCSKHYDGQPLETGGTSIQGGASPGVKRLFKKGFIKEGQNVLDYGAGKFGRNSKFLRENGVTVYSFDPFNGESGVNGWEEVSNEQPQNKEQFDVVFTAFVINVVPYHIEQDIIADLNNYNNAEQYHLTRNMDIFDTVKSALQRKDKTVGEFFVNQFADEDLENSYENGTLTDEEILEFCCFGVETSRGFQRIPYMEENDFDLIIDTKGFKLYKR